MRSPRLALASGVALGCIFLGLLPPLQALLVLRAERPPGPKSPGPPPATAGLSPDETAATPARPPFTAHTDARGRVRRLYFPRTALVGTPEERARQLLSIEAPPLGLAANSPQLALGGVRWSPSGPHVRLQQQCDGIPVWGAEAVVSFDAALAPQLVASDLEDVPAGMAGDGARLPPPAAAATAVQALGATGPLQSPPTATLYWHRRAGRWRLEYRVGFVCESPAGDWEAWIDAHDGGVREIRDRTVFEAGSGGSGAGDGTARVFLPDPCLATGDPSLQDASNADAAVPEAAYTTVALRSLDPPTRGFYRLTGPWAVVPDWESPASAPDSSPTSSFLRRRSESGFEDLMVYYHIDATQRWIQSLGFADANARPQIADAHGMRGQDNSKFVPSLHKLSFGDGGVDDAEDAEVIVHEYGHAVQFDVVATWGTGGHTGALGEGDSDYLANSYAWALYPERVQAWNGVFQWDGHNALWPGRRAIDPALHYPEDALGEIHRSGTLWCSALTDGLYALGDRSVMDRLLLDAHYALTGMATMEDAANAVLVSDVVLYHGAHLAVLVETFGRWGLVDSASWRPVTIEHTPLDIAVAGAASPRIVARVVSSVAAIDPTSVVARVRTAGGAWSSLPLPWRGGDTYAEDLRLPPSEDLEVEYFIEARDGLGNFTRLPASAPDNPLRLAVGRVAERFEADAGWFPGVPDDDAFAGRWVRAVPIGTIAQPDADHTSFGSACFVTGNGAPGAPASEADVDGGKTTLLSPLWDLRGATAARLSYYRWFSNDQGTAPEEDPWMVDVSNDAGVTWVPLENITISAAGWQRMEFDLASKLGALGRVRVRFVARDAGAGSLVEAAVDDLLLQVRTATDAAAMAVPRLALLPNAPNPCNPSTTLHFSIDRAGSAQLSIYDVRGRLVRALLAAPLAAGPHTLAWDGRDAGGTALPSGVYVARLTTETGSALRKITVLR